MKKLEIALALLAIGCATAVPRPTRVASSTSPEPRISRAPEVELVWKGDEPWARRGDEEWRLGDMKRAEMVFSPDGKRFAYLRQRTSGNARVLVRNLLGDPVNDFAVYRPGLPAALAWLDDRRLGYLAPLERGRAMANVFVVHDAETGEVLSARPGSGFTWDGRHRHIAFLAGVPGKQALVVDGRNVWPRAGFTKLHGEPVWSGDGHGIAFVDEGNGAPKLVVLVEFQNPQGDLTWPVPREALSPGLKVFWASESKVVIGESALKPKFAAGWDRLQ